MSDVKKWNGSSWVNANAKKWNGSSWVNADVKKWNGSSWGGIATQRYESIFLPTWSRTYRGNGTKRTDYRGQVMCQGKYEDTWGIMRSLCGFNVSEMKTTLAGAKIISASVYLYNEHWYYTNGGTAYIGRHNHASEPNTFSHDLYGMTKEGFTSRGQSKWITVPTSFGEGLRDGWIAGISLYADSTQMNHYGVFYGANNGHVYKPKIKVVYEK